MARTDTRDTPWFFDALLVLTCTAFAIWMACFSPDSVKFEGHYIPRFNDSFYHATRILATYINPDNFYQWDENSFYPGGAFNSWPWFYDYTLARLMRLVSPAEPMKFLDFIPPAWILVNCLLLLAICRKLGMKWQARTLALACFAISPLTQLLHMLGRIDHHYMEYTMVLGTLASLLAWVNRPDSRRHALLAGCFPGLAVGINPGLFALQVPLLGSLFILWVKRASMPERTSLDAGVAMVLVTLALTVFSEPALVGMFKFDLLSWFHVYVAVCSALVMWLMSRLPFRAWSLIALMLLGALLSYPLLSSYGHGVLFLKANGPLLHIHETLSIFEAPRDYLRTSSGLLLIAPITVIGCLVALFRSKTPRIIVLACFSVFGLMLLAIQHRLHYFGSFALYVPPLLFTQHMLQRLDGDNRRRGWLLATTVIALASLNTPRELLTRQHPAVPLPARAIHILSDVCAKHPATVLTSLNVAHQVRFLTGCRVMANAMQGIDVVQTTKAMHVRELLSLTPAQLLAQSKDFSYLLEVNTLGSYIQDQRNLDFPGIATSFDKPDSIPPGYERLSLERFVRYAPFADTKGGLMDTLFLNAFKPRKHGYIYQEYVLMKIDKEPGDAGQKQQGDS